jgi:hypothetical protein
MLLHVLMFGRSNGAVAILRPVPKARDADERGPVKTTVELPGELWRSAKIRAMDDRVDLRTVFIRALEGYLGMPPNPVTKRGRSENQ